MSISSATHFGILCQIRCADDGMCKPLILIKYDEADF